MILVNIIFLESRYDQVNFLQLSMKQKTSMFGKCFPIVLFFAFLYTPVQEYLFIAVKITCLQLQVQIRK